MNADKPSKETIQTALDSERKIVHLMLKDRKAIAYFRQQGVTPDWFNDCHKSIVEYIYAHDKDGCLFTPEAYRTYLIVGGGTLKTIPLLMDTFAKCDLKVYADIDDMPALLKLQKESIMRNKVCSEFNGFLKTVTGDNFNLKTCQEQLSRLQNQLAKLDTPQTTFNPIRVCDIPDDPEPQWVWTNYISRGETTLIAGLPKCGKTTLLATILDKMATGGNCITHVKAGKVLVVSEERARIWKKRGGTWKHVEVVCKPALPWEILVDNIVDHITKNKIDMVVIDTLSEHAQLEDENDSAKVLKALRVSDKIVAAGAALVFLHHCRKSGGDYGLGARGSNAITGKVDAVMTMNRVGLDNSDNRRRIDLVSRITDNSSTIVVLENGEYRYVSPQETNMETDIKYLMQLPAFNEQGKTKDEIMANWNDGETPSEKQVRTMLNTLLAEKRINRTGEGKCGNPYRYNRIG